MAPVSSIHSKSQSTSPIDRENHFELFIGALCAENCALAILVGNRKNSGLPDRVRSPASVPSKPTKTHLGSLLNEGQFGSP